MEKKRNSMDVSNCSQTGIILNVSKFYIERTVALKIAFRICIFLLFLHMYNSVNGIHFIHLWKSLWEDDCWESSNYCPCTGASIVNEQELHKGEHTHMKHVGKAVWAQSTFNNFYIWRKIILHTKNIYMYTWSVQYNMKLLKTITTQVFILQEMSPAFPDQQLLMETECDFYSPVCNLFGSYFS